MRTIEKIVYTFEELSDEAKDKAREWWRGAWGADCEWWDCTIEDCAQILAILGIDCQTKIVQLCGGGTRKAPNVFFSLGYSQSDYASFEGTWSYSKGWAKRLQHYCPNDRDVFSIGEALQYAAKCSFYNVNANISHSRYGVSVSVCDATTQAQEDAVHDAMQDVCRWIYSRLRSEYEYQQADEQVDEALTSMGYEFDMEGCAS